MARPPTPGGDQQQVGQRTEADDGAHVLPPDALPQHKGVLGANGYDQRGTEDEAGAEGWPEHERENMPNSFGLVQLNFQNHIKQN